MVFFRATADPARTVVHGRVVTMGTPSEVLRDASVCVEDDRIAAIVPLGTEVPPAFAGATVVDTGGTIYPGLIDLHNHLGYNFLPLWGVPARYTNRNIWRTREPRYGPEVAWPADIITKNRDTDYVRSTARYVECRALFGGTTTSQGISFSGGPGRDYYRGLVRNVEAPDVAGLPGAIGRTLDYDDRSHVRRELVPALQKGRPFIYHLSEGTDADARQRFLDLEVEPGHWAIAPNLVAIHGVALEAGDLARLRGAAGLVWSPLSNLLLYGETADVAAAARRGVPVALGADWSPSGSKNLLGELKIAGIVNDLMGSPFADEDLIRMVTSRPAAMLGWEQAVGSIATGRLADLLVVEGAGGDPYRALREARESDILFVMIGGRVRLGRVEHLALVPGREEVVRIGGRPYLLDLAQSNDPLNGLSFTTATAKLSYGLEHMPELGREFVTDRALYEGLTRDQPLAIYLEYDAGLDGASSLFAAAATAIDPDQLVPMVLEPATEADDIGYRARLRANSNLPDEVRARL